MQNRLPWFPCFPSKLLGALSAMEPNEGYIYVVILLRIYEVGGPCIDTVETLSRRSGLAKSKVTNAIDRLLSTGKLKHTECGFQNATAEKIIEDRETSKTALKNGGKLGAEKRWKKTEQNQRLPDGVAIDTPMGSDSYLESDIDSEKIEYKKDYTLALTGGDVVRSDYSSDAFDQFWSRYPHKIGKGEAKKSFDRARKRVTFADLMAGLENYIRAKPPDRSWCNPATFLNQDRWHDAPAENAPARGPSFGGRGGSFLDI